MKIFQRTFVVSVLTLGLGVLSAHGQSNILINVDVSDPAAVKLTATSNLSWLNNVDFTFSHGFDLRSFFTGDAGNWQSGYVISTTPYTLAPSLQTNRLYNAWNTDDRSGGENYVDLSFSRIGGSSTVQPFSNSAPAFVGSCMINLSVKSDYLPSFGAYGDIALGYKMDGDPIPVIGQWQAIPEPSTMVLVIFGGAAALFVSRRNRRHAR